MATINRLDNANTLNLGTAWSGGVAPGSGDVATWSGIVTNVSTAFASGSTPSWGGIALLSGQTSNIQIGSVTATITLGASGIDLSASGANFTTTGAISLALAANQAWNVASGRTLTVAGVISGNARNVTFGGIGTKTLQGASTGWTNSTALISEGLVTASNNNSLGAASNTVTIASGAALQVTATAPAQTAWSASGSGLSGVSYGAFWTSGAFGSTRTITAKANNTVLSFRTGVAFTGIIAVDAGVTAITLNGEGTPGNGNTYTMTSQSPYTATVTLSALGLNGSTDTGTKYSIGSTANATDQLASGGGGLGNNSNNVIIDTTGGIASNAVGSTFKRNYTFNARGARKAYDQFKIIATGTATFDTGTLTFSGGASDYVQFSGANGVGYIIKLNGTITGGANLDVGSNGTNGSVDATLELGSALNSSGWTGGLTVNYIRYGSSLANANPITFVQAAPSRIDAVVAGLTVRHSSYSSTSNGIAFTGTNDLTMTGPVSGSADWSSAPGTWQVEASTLTLGFNFTGAGVLTKTSAGTLALAGANSGISSLAWNAGNLTLNSAGAAGTSGTASFTAASASGILDSTTGATLSQGGSIFWNANFTWNGTASLTFGSGGVSWPAARTIAFGSSGGTGTLRFAGSATTTTATYNLNIGNSQTGAKQTLTLAGSNASRAAGTSANQHAVTAGYFRIENNNGLGDPATLYTTTWWIGATNAGTQTVGANAALELAGVTTPDTKNVNLYTQGPNSDGALIGASGTSVFSGNISVPNVAGTRIGVRTGATFTLLGSGSYPNLNPANASTPLSFTAESGGTLNQDRVLGANVGTVAVTGGSGTVVFSRANLHTGAMTCSAGTTKLTHANAAGAGAGNNVTVSPGATMEVAVKAVFPATLTLGSSGSAATFKVSV